ncbi:hypothetical protein CEXT_382261 [Caerostris extrusa]|uniref:Uncharacterized protein n=1 Tax=Caerostris extrusa TaxID=172846 RepID=A0AAV4NMH2_CAEEX|nr:hypothetical protein CEXT_382261 [Caerostris extrusa]
MLVGLCNRFRSQPSPSPSRNEMTEKNLGREEDSGKSCPISNPSSIVSYYQKANCLTEDLKGFSNGILTKEKGIPIIIDPTYPSGYSTPIPLFPISPADLAP